MITLIKNANLYSPVKMGIKDILITGNKIADIQDSINLSGIEYKTIDAAGKFVCPGFIDQHVHISGGGGQNGFASFIPEVTVKELISVGTTTVLGLLGTDGFVKELSSLYAKTKELDAEGITAYMLTGFYGLPQKTLTGSIANDMIFIDKVIGYKLAISDDRCSFPTEQEVLRFINQVKLGGFTSGKGGIIHFHVGNLPSRLDLLISIASQYPTLISYLSPTHCIRTKELFDSALKFAGMGGMIDISTGGTKFTAPYKAVGIALEAGVSLENLTFSSDGRGGVKKTDPVTGEQSYTAAPLDLNFKEMILLVKNGILPLEKALQLITVNPAKNMKISHKGEISIGYDADFVFMDNNYNITDVIANGKQMIADGSICYKPTISI